MTRKTRELDRLPMLRGTAHQIWLAGLGALGVAEEEGGRVFTRLVKKGHLMERGNKARLEGLLNRVNGVKADARRRIGRLANPMNQGMTTALHRLGIPTQREIATLTRRVEQLTQAVGKPSRRPVARRRARSATATA